jgi:quercetin dioxygenase-like cupin family protein
MPHVIFGLTRPNQRPVLTGPGAGRTVTKSSGSSTELKLAGEQSSGDWAAVEWQVRAGDEPPIHIHTREDETLYVLDGSITAFVGDQRIDVAAGAYAALPKDARTIHRARRRSAPARHPRAGRRGVLFRAP